MKGALDSRRFESGRHKCGALDSCCVELWTGVGCGQVTSEGQKAGGLWAKSGGRGRAG